MNDTDTQYISSIPQLKKEIIEGLNADDSGFMPEDEVKWD